MNDPEEDRFDIQLRHALQAGDEPADHGFTSKVMADLPAQAPQRARRIGEWAQQLHWAAVSVAGCGVAVLFSTAGAAPEPAQQIAAYTLLALLALWSIPSRWSRL